MKILVLASGGDSQGMNRVIYNLYKHYKTKVYGCECGFAGLIEGNILPLKHFKPAKHKNNSGVCIKSSRCPEFNTEAGFAKALKNAKNYDYIVILGGNGSKKGAKELEKNGIKVVFVPATIDNDIDNSQYSLGFDSAVNACCYSINNIMPSVNSFKNRVCVFVVMGNSCSKIAENVSDKVNADYLIKSEDDIDYKKIVNTIEKTISKQKNTVIILKEKLLKSEDFVQKLQAKVKNVFLQYFEIGYLQRGSKPTKFEILQANKISKKIFKSIKSQNSHYIYFQKDKWKF